MAQATTIKRKKAQPQTANDLEISKQKLISKKKNVIYSGYKYTEPIKMLIAFETSEESQQGDVRGAIHKLMNKPHEGKEGRTFTAVVNDAVIEYLKINKVKIKKVK